MEYTVVVAEDEEIILNNIIKKIEQSGMGFKVVGKAVTGRQALSLIESESPDVLFTDIRMPVMDGLELIESVYLRYPYVKKVIISGYAEFDYAKRAIEFEVQDYLLKPFDMEKMLSVLAKIRIELESEADALKRSFNIPAGQKSPEEVAKLLQEYIKENFATDINFNVIADSLNYSPSYLSKLFSHYFGESPSKYLMDLRINRAKYLLKNYKNLSVKQIGEAVGYSDQCYFSRIFKNITGVNPLNYRHEEQ
jgi:YesN/AraC family two-component response regulator